MEKWGGQLDIRPPHSKNWGGRVPPIPPRIDAPVGNTQLMLLIWDFDAGHELSR